MHDIGDAGEHEALRASLGQAAEVYTSLQLPRTFTLADLHSKVEHRRGRPIELIGQTMPTTRLHGLWIAGQEADYIFYDARTSPVHRAAIIAHEYGHVVNEDQPTTSEQRRLLIARLLPNIDPDTINRIAGRTTYEQEAERRAELFSTIVIAGLDNWSMPRPTPADASLLARIAAALDGAPERQR